ILMGTAQLDTFPQAKAAFLRAAATWESLITTPITIVINVDFGPNRFGTPFPQGVLGSTGTQTLGQNGLFPDVRTKLKSIASSSAEAALDDQLPQGKVPTDFGAVDAVFAPSALLRVLGFINSVADPVSEQNSFGNPPAIGFNSNFPFDFN